MAHYSAARRTNPARSSAKLLDCRNLAVSSRNVPAKENPGRLASRPGFLLWSVSGVSGPTRYR